MPARPMHVYVRSGAVESPMCVAPPSPFNELAPAAVGRNRASSTPGPWPERAFQWLTRAPLAAPPLCAPLFLHPFLRTRSSRVAERTADVMMAVPKKRQSKTRSAKRKAIWLGKPRKAAKLAISRAAAAGYDPLADDEPETAAPPTPEAGSV
ncbi:hypothetical protein T492DRAFT_981424 [Pavlovales sp. CCMP2436]|nr:hypothetical protein T492DRAFT_981424 [Pavlovales sp. CCMP2436]